MFWPALFAIGVAQGLFLVTLILLRRSENVLAARLMIGMLVPMVISHVGYFVIRTDFLYDLPQAFGFSFGTVFLFGPLFYLYTRAILDSDFHWTRASWLHFIPYAIQLIINMPFLLEDKAIWIGFIQTFLTGDLRIDTYPKIAFAAQNTHLLVYLVVTFKWIRSRNASSARTSYLVPILARIRWVKALMVAFGLFTATVLSLYVFIVINGKYDPVTNYVYTLTTTGIIYYVGFVLVLNPQIVSPDFNQKYRTYMPFDGDGGEAYVRKLKSVFDDDKLFTNPDLKLAVVAAALKLPQHQVSKLINEKFGKSFTDLVTEYRVREFISRVNDPAHQSHSFLAIALDVGFSSKSAFNSAFKKTTGKTPSDYRKNP